VGFAGDVEATVVWVTTWRRAECFRTLATRRWCLDGDLTRGVSDRSSLAIALAAALKELGRRHREPRGGGQRARPDGGGRAVGRAAQLRQRHSAYGDREHRGCGQGKPEPLTLAARLRFAAGWASDFTLACRLDFASKSGLQLGRASRCARASGRLTALMVLLKLPQDLVALNIGDGCTIVSDRPLIGRRDLRRNARCGGSAFRSEGRKDLVGRANVDVVEVESPKHAQRRIAIGSGRLVVRCRRYLWETPSPLWSIRIERVDARQWPIVLVPARTGHLPDRHSTIELIRRVALILLSLALMTPSFHRKRSPSVYGL
jgi:hypothetical protein